MFSYFMLADQIEVETRRMNPDTGKLDDALKVSVPGSGSLFQMHRPDSVKDACVIGRERECGCTCGRSFRAR